MTITSVIAVFELDKWSVNARQLKRKKWYFDPPVGFWMKEVKAIQSRAVLWTVKCLNRIKNHCKWFAICVRASVPHSCVRRRKTVQNAQHDSTWCENIRVDRPQSGNKGGKSHFGERQQVTLLCADRISLSDVTNNAGGNPPMEEDDCNHRAFPL